MEGVTGGVGSGVERGADGGGALAAARASCCSACSLSALVHGSSSSWGWCWRSINTDHYWSRWSDCPPGCLVSARC